MHRMAMIRWSDLLRGDNTKAKTGTEGDRMCIELGKVEANFPPNRGLALPKTDRHELLAETGPLEAMQKIDALNLQAQRAVPILSGH
jgi:hypothetical protein